jgi:hypothetical protein
MTRDGRVWLVRVLFIFLTIFVYSLQPSSSLNATSTPAPISVMCTSVAGSSPGILRCGIKAAANGFVSKLDPDHVHGNSYAYCKEGTSFPAAGFFCDSRILIVEEVPSAPQQRDEAYVKFDLSGLPDYLLTSHARPVMASLWLFTEFLSGFQNASVQVHRVLTNDWSESNLTWNTKPTFAPEYVTQQVAATNAWIAWDVSAATQTAMAKSSQISFALTPSGISPQNYVWFRSRDYGDYSPQPDNVTTGPELDMDFVEPLVTILTSIPHMPVFVDRTVVQTDTSGEIQLYLPWGQHQINVPGTIPIDQSTRNAFRAWSDGVQQSNRTVNVGGNLTLSAEYGVQHKVEASSPYGLVMGAGWYFENTTATISVSPTNLPADGVMGYLGVRHVFDHWTGACTTSGSQCAVLVNGPKSAYALWHDDYTLPLLAVAILIIGLMLSVLVRRRKRA